MMEAMSSEKEDAVPPLVLPYRKIDEGKNEFLGIGNPLAIKAVPSLLKAGLRVASITERISYTGGSPGINGDHEFVLLLQGELAVLQEGELNWLKPGELAYTPPNTELAWRGKQDGQVWFLYLCLTDIPRWEGLKAGGPRIRRYESAELLYHYLRQILDAVCGGRSRDVRLARLHSRSLLDLLKHEIVLAGETARRITPALKELTIEIQKRPGAPWTVDEMATRLQTSRRALTKHFQAEYGAAPMDYVIKQRIARGAEMLIQESKSVSQVAHALGYQSLQSFSNLFLKQTGLRPSAYRAKFSQSDLARS